MKNAGRGSRAARRTAAVLISGSGSNLQALMDAAQRGDLPLDIAAVVSNRPDAFGLERARRAGIPAACVASAHFPQRSDFEAALLAVLGPYAPDYLLLAGFMRILSPPFVRRHAGRMLNVHPSLLPRFPGLDTHRRVLEAGDRRHGCTVHFVTEQLDGGPAIIQGQVPVHDTDDAGSLAARVLAMEHRIYPRAAALLATGRAELRDGAVWLDGERLDAPLLFEADSGDG